MDGGTPHYRELNNYISSSGTTLFPQYPPAITVAATTGANQLAQREREYISDSNGSDEERGEEQEQEEVEKDKDKEEDKEKKKTKKKKKKQKQKLKQKELFSRNQENINTDRDELAPGNSSKG